MDKEQIMREGRQLLSCTMKNVISEGYASGSDDALLACKFALEDGQYLIRYFAGMGVDDHTATAITEDAYDMICQRLTLLAA